MRYFYTSELYHHGIKGQRWGVRRYQNKDGTLTSEGMKRYGLDDVSKARRVSDKYRVSNRYEYRRERDTIAGKIANTDEAMREDARREKKENLKSLRSQKKEIGRKEYKQYKKGIKVKAKDQLKDIDDSTRAAREHAERYLYKKYGARTIAVVERNEKIMGYASQYVNKFLNGN